MIQKSISGNALFLILIAVALFAALSYAITQSGRGGGSIDKEQAQIQASQALQSMAQLNTDLTRFQILSGLDIHDISFANTVESGYANPTPYPTTQHLFHTDGGGATWPATPNGADDWLISASTGIAGMGKETSCTDTTPCAEFIAILRNVPYALCKALNDMGEVTNTNGNPPVDIGDFEDIKYQGSRTNFLSGSHAFNALNGEADGKQFACLETTQGYRGGPGKYYFYFSFITDVHG